MNSLVSSRKRKICKNQAASFWLLRTSSQSIPAGGRSMIALRPCPTSLQHRDSAALRPGDGRILPPRNFPDDLIRPDPKLTPGDTLPVTTDEICEPGYSKFVRRYVSGWMKEQVYREYGIETHKPGEYEIDHLISISLGGSNDLKNLWPQSLDDTKLWNAKLKDRLERRLHRLVCDERSLKLRDEQEAISRDWIAAYRKYVGE